MGRGDDCSPRAGLGDLQQSVEPVAGCGVSVAPATPISITTVVGSLVAIPIIWASVAISIAVITTAIMSPGVSVVVGNLFDLRVRDSGTIQRERGHGVGRAGTRK
jgi:hypothetical protein